MSDNSCIIELSEGDIKNNKIRISACGREFFPEDAFGGSDISHAGKPVTLQIEGVNQDIKTDLPTNKAGNPRWIFRERGWVGFFLKDQGLKAGDKIKITREGKRKYYLEPVRDGLTFIDLFAGIGGIKNSHSKMSVFI